MDPPLFVSDTFYGELGILLSSVVSGRPDSVDIDVH